MKRIGAVILAQTLLKVFFFLSYETNKESGFFPPLLE